MAGSFDIASAAAMHCGELIAVIEEAKALASLPGNDFSWSSWPDEGAALTELDAILNQLGKGELPDLADLSVLFAPTGPLQEVSLSSGWGQQFLLLASRFDAALERVERSAGARTRGPS
jgi:hypothetical protein